MKKKKKKKEKMTMMMMTVPLKTYLPIKLSKGV
jgi:hypothetical protein